MTLASDFWPPTSSLYTVLPLHIVPRSLDSLPVSLTGVTPDLLADKSLAEIEALEVWQGNRQRAMGELFDLSGDASDGVWRLSGNFSSVHYLAAEMRGGDIHVEGDVGRHTGEQMRGGKLTINGHAGDWLGAHMRGGQIHMTGNAGNHVGGVRAAEKMGMRGGHILVKGSVGDYAAERMRRGWIVVLGDCGDWPGYQMRAGTLMVFGRSGANPGASMRRGTIALLGTVPELPLSYRYACDCQPQALALLLNELRSQGVELAIPIDCTVALHNGDLLEGGRGEIWLARQAI